MKKILLVAVFILMFNVVCSAQVPVLLYHNTYESFSAEQADMNIAPSVFEQHLKGLDENGYNVIGIDDYASYLRGNFILPEKPLIITFDDGYLSNYLYAYPLLKKYGMKAAIFVVTGRVGDNDTVFPHFSWQQAAEMEQSGIISIYSHTDTHVNLKNLNTEALNIELRRSKYLIETNLNKTCDIIAAPFGLFDSEVTAAAKKAGYSVICRVDNMSSEADNGGLESLRRFTVHGDMSVEDVIDGISDY